MNRETLLDFFDDRIRSSSDFLVYDNGYRTYSHTYNEIREAATRLAHRLEEAGLAPELGLQRRGGPVLGTRVRPVDFDEYTRARQKEEQMERSPSRGRSFLLMPP